MMNETYVILDELPDVFLDEIINIGYEIGFEPSKIYIDSKNISNNIDNNMRSSEQAWLPQNNYHHLWNRITDYFLFANRVNFNFDISHGIYEVQILKYNHTTNDHFNWHHDVIYESQTSHRKISMTIQLSDPNTYEGGDILFGNNVESFSDLDPVLQQAKKRGSVVMFNSYMRHCVTPVTRGVRYSLVAWASGPPFR